MRDQPGIGVHLDESLISLALHPTKYQLVNFSAGVDFDSGLWLSDHVDNLLDEDAPRSFDRKRGGRPRLGYTVGQRRTFGIAAHNSFWRAQKGRVPVAGSCSFCCPNNRQR